MSTEGTMVSIKAQHAVTTKLCCFLFKSSLHPSSAGTGRTGLPNSALCKVNMASFCLGAERKKELFLPIFTLTEMSKSQGQIKLSFSFIFFPAFCIFGFKGVEQQKRLSPKMPMAWKFGQSPGDRMSIPFIQNTRQKEVLPSPPQPVS